MKTPYTCYPFFFTFYISYIWSCPFLFPLLSWLIIWSWLSLVLRFDSAQTHTSHTVTKRLTDTCKHMLTQPVICSQQLSVLYWINNLLILKVCFTQKVYNTFTTPLHNADNACWLASIKISPSSKMQNLLTDMIWMSKIYWQKQNIGKGRAGIDYK